MRICTNCKIEANDDVKFCPFCGNGMSEVRPISETQPAETLETPIVKKPHLALKIVSMALSIAGFAFMCFGFLYTLLGLVEEGMALGMAFTFSLFFLPLCIVGMVLSCKCINAGDTSALTRVGKILGLIGIIISGVCLFIGFASIMSI